MKFAIYIPNFGAYYDPKDIVNIAVEAEKAGWDGFFIWDHLIFGKGRDIPFLDPWIALTAIAIKTNKMKIGTMVTPIPRRRPWKLARECVSLDHLSNGRLILGVGLGNPMYDYTSFNESFDPHIRAKKLDEGLDILKGLWSAKNFSYNGEFYTIKNVKFLPKPVNDDIPIWVAGMWPNKKPFLRAARYEGVFPISIKFPKQLTPEDIKDITKFMSIHHKISPNYNIAITGDTPGNRSDAINITKPFEQVGVTWWCENINLLRFNKSLEDMIKRVRQGPPSEIN